MMKSYQVEREQMVETQIARRGIKDQRVLSAMRSVQRHLFLPAGARDWAYADGPIRIGCGQTISQPYIVALMTELLDVKPDHRVLDVGTGSGYQAAILGELASEVHTIERHPELAKSAEEQLAALGCENITVHVGDGTQGLESFAPYDRILVAAAAPSVPGPLLNQLRDGGRLVIPVGSRFSQRLEIWDRVGDKNIRKSDIPVVFVPLIGENGWNSK
ncbi:MAG: protein-L-isoaspartate(D-aspartate) O-methyltransferase [Chloroflexota bacterium]|nr:protein-L-isoaspartate(D-aspartate) O-methyltransferase [Chloroflexota bacterium]